MVVNLIGEIRVYALM